MNHPPIRDVAIIGSGLAGLTAAIRLRERGLKCTVFEKRRGPGGRLSSKRIEGGSLDLGAQFFTIRNSGFRDFLDQYAGAGSYAAWKADLRFEEAPGKLVDFREADRYVGVPRMDALTRGLSRSLGSGTNSGVSSGGAGTVNLHYEHRISRVRYEGGGWYLWTDANLRQGPFDALVVTAPPAQAAELLAADPSVTTALAGYGMEPCWAVAGRYDQPLEIGFDAALCKHPVLGWVARDSSKPQRRSDQDWWVLHAQASWSRQHQDDDPGAIRAAVTKAFQERFGVTSSPVTTLSHRWLYAKPTTGPGPGHLAFDSRNLGLCGDWLSGGRVEGAYESAQSLIADWQTQGRVGA